MNTALPADGTAPAPPSVSDWSHMVNFTPRNYFQPKTLDEVKSVLAGLAGGGSGQGSVKVLGGLHSCSTIAQSGSVIDTSLLPPEFEVAPIPGGGAGGRVTASAFMHARDFLERAAGHNLSLTALGGTDEQTLAGLLATNTAGATVHHSIYEGLQWAEFLTIGADGKSVVTVTIDATDQKFPAVAASLGALGFMTRVCFDLVPERYYTGSYEAVPLDSIVGHIEETCHQFDFWRFEWFPETARKDLCLRWTAMPYNGPPDPDGDYKPDTSEAILKWLMEKDESLFHDGPFTNEALKLEYRAIMASYNLLGRIFHDSTATGPMRNIIPVDRRATLLCAMAEWSFDPADLETVMDICRDYFGKAKWPNLPIEIECTRTDNFWMSPWNWPGLPYIIKFNFQYLTVFLSEEEKAEIAPHLEGLWNELVKKGIRFKAHWGKINFLTPEFIAANYQPAPFLPLVNQLFLNDYLRQRLPARG